MNQTQLNEICDDVAENIKDAIDEYVDEIKDDIENRIDTLKDTLYDTVNDVLSNYFEISREDIDLNSAVRKINMMTPGANVPNVPINVYTIQARIEALSKYYYNQRARGESSTSLQITKAKIDELKALVGNQ